MLDKNFFNQLNAELKYVANHTRNQERKRQEKQYVSNSIKKLVLGFTFLIWVITYNFDIITNVLVKNSQAKPNTLEQFIKDRHDDVLYLSYNRYSK